MDNNALIYLFSKYHEYYPYLLPLGFLGIWRWSVWGIKKIIGSYYKPKVSGYRSTVSLITPVYNENPETFKKAIDSWRKNNPTEIIAIIDYTDKKSIKIFKEFANKNSNARFLVTKTPGKREALADGIRMANGDILALVDSDTIWTKDTLINAVAPFKDKDIGGVTTRQSVENPQTIAQKLFSIRLEQRYWDDVPFLATAEDVLVCLSGRTSLYRKEAILPLLDQLTDEKFLGEKVISGEDKRLTYLIEALGWKTTYQSNSLVITTGVKDLGSFFKQQIRWTRNSWRNDLRALLQGWTLKYPIFTLYLIDRLVQPFTQLISPIYFIISIYFRLWVPVAVIFIWWHLSRLVKMYPHLKKYPKDIKILSVFIMFNFITAYIRIYSLLTINTQGWITRWDKARLSRLSFVRNALPHFGTVTMFLILGAFVFTNKYKNFIIPTIKQNELISKTLLKTNTLIASAGVPSVLGVSTDQNESWLTKRYVYQAGDTLDGIANKFGITLETLLAANGSKITNWNQMEQGTNLTIPAVKTKLALVNKFNFQRTYPDPLLVYYDQPTDQIVVSGRGKTISLKEIAANVGSELLEEVEPGVWDLRASIYIRSGLTFLLNSDEVKWLRLASNDDKITRIFAYNSDVFIDSVKITSWDEERNDYDRDMSNGRSYVLVKDGSRMDITNSELAYLGFPRPDDLAYSPYGVSWKMSKASYGKLILTGEVTNSKFHDNFFGAYTFGATGMTWKDNEFYGNVRYGLDPHDDSNGFLVEGNVFRNNGTHGLIFSKRCLNNIVMNNVSYENGLHGIMLHELSNKNLIVNNTIYDNHDGIAVDHSSNNLIKGNKIYGNKRGVRADKSSINNQIENNSVTDSSQYGIYLYGNSNDNSVRNNILTNNINAIYIKSNNNLAFNNILSNNTNGIYFTGEAANNKVVGNKITYNKSYGIYAKVAAKVSNYIEESNYIWRNKADLRAAEVF